MCYVMMVGLFEFSLMGKKGILFGSWYLCDIFKVKGYEVYYKEYLGGYDYVIWEWVLVWGIEVLFFYLNYY